MRDSPVASAARAMPPRPKARASVAAPRRRWRSFNNSRNRSYFCLSCEVVSMQPLEEIRLHAATLFVRLSLASGSWDGRVKVWDAFTGKEDLTFTGHAAPVCSVGFSPGGRLLASASEDRTVMLWDLSSGELAFTLLGHKSTVTGVGFSPDGRRLASVSADRTVKVWDAVTGQMVLTRRGLDIVKLWATAEEAKTSKGSGHTDLSGISFSPDGRYVAAPSGEKSVKMWDAETLQEVLTLNGHAGTVLCVSFSPDGRRIASGSEDRTVEVWNISTGQEVLTLEEHTSHVFSVSFSPDGKRLASASDDGTVKVWDADSGE